jgi:hypothetical protein
MELGMLFPGRKQVVHKTVVIKLIERGQTAYLGLKERKYYNKFIETS